MRPFNAIVLVIFAVLALVGVFVFATFTSSQQDVIGKVEIWGSIPNEVMDDALTAVRDGRNDFQEVSYREYPEADLVPSLVKAIASGTGPDAVLFPSASVLADGDKLQHISFNTLSRREFQDTFVEAGELFLVDDGVLGLPLTIDPLVMYWNRTMLQNAGVARPPRSWDEVAELAPRLSKKTDAGTLTASAVALGEWGNVAHAKEILMTVFTQLGVPVLVRDVEGGWGVSLVAQADSRVQPGESALRFYTEFSDPVKPVYAWNRSERLSRDAFTAGTLALYFAPASELRSIRAANPNLNFDVAPMPVAVGGGEGAAARLLALAIPNGAQNPDGAETAIQLLTSSEVSSLIADALLLPSPRRDVGGVGQDAFQTVFRSAALKAFAFPDPDPIESDVIFARMVGNVSSGRLRVGEALRDAEEELQQLLRTR